MQACPGRGSLHQCLIIASPTPNRLQGELADSGSWWSYTSSFLATCNPDHPRTASIGHVTAAALRCYIRSISVKAIAHDEAIIGHVWHVDERERLRSTGVDGVKRR